MPQANADWPLITMSNRNSWDWRTFNVRAVPALTPFGNSIALPIGHGDSKAIDQRSPQSLSLFSSPLITGRLALLV